MKKQIIQLFHNIISKWAKLRQGTATGEKGALQEELAFGKAAGDREEVDRHDGMVWAAEGLCVADRKTFAKAVDDILADKQGQGCLLIAGLDRFKDVNNIYGHDVGDLVLQSVAGTFRDVFGEGICLGRLNGDLFALWAPELSFDSAEYVRSRVGVVNDRLLHPEKELPPISLSAGVAFCEEGDNCRSLGKRANGSLYRVKESGRCGCEIYDGRSGRKV